MGVNFGMEEGTLHAKFHPHKRPAGAYPLRDFQQICGVCTQFQYPLGVKIWLDLLEGYGVMGVLS